MHRAMILRGFALCGRVSSLIAASSWINRIPVASLFPHGNNRAGDGAVDQLLAKQFARQTWTLEACAEDGEWFERVVTDQLEFLARHVPLG